jgi:hypothetical protein
MRPLILEEYAPVMLHRDLAERNAIRNKPLMQAFLRHCFRTTATLLSLSKLLVRPECRVTGSAVATAAAAATSWPSGRTTAALVVPPFRRGPTCW